LSSRDVDIDLDVNNLVNNMDLTATGYLVNNMDLAGFAAMGLVVGGGRA
jgi:hypothetical protein